MHRQTVRGASGVGINIAGQRRCRAPSDAAGGELQVDALAEHLAGRAELVLIVSVLRTCASRTTSSARWA